MITTRVTSFLAGALLANSAPHLATAITGRRHLTPLAGKNSSATVNGIWAALNAAGSVALLRPTRRHGGDRWDIDLPAFEAGYLCLAAWMATSETVFRLNSARTTGAVSG